MSGNVDANFLVPAEPHLPAIVPRSLGPAETAAVQRLPIDRLEKLSGHLDGATRERVYQEKEDRKAGARAAETRRSKPIPVLSTAGQAKAPTA